MCLQKLFSIVPISAARLLANINARFFAALLILAICAPGSLARAQYCNPALVSYIVRDENGRALNGLALQSVYKQLPKSIGNAQIYIAEVSLAENGERFYRAESVDWAKGEKIPALNFINDRSCAMQLGEVTLTYKGKQMRLVFNLEITRTQPDRLRRWVIDSPPFQEGAFAVDVDGWPRYENEVIPAGRWKAILHLTPDPRRVQSVNPAKSGRLKPDTKP